MRKGVSVVAFLFGALCAGFWLFLVANVLVLLAAFIKWDITVMAAFWTSGAALVLLRLLCSITFCLGVIVVVSTND